MWNRLSRIAGLLAFVIATMAGPAMAQAKPVEPMPCHEMTQEMSRADGHDAAHEMPVEKAPTKKMHDCDSACQCPVSHCAVGQLILPFDAAPVVYGAADRTVFAIDQRLNFALSDDLLRPPRA